MFNDVRSQCDVQLDELTKKMKELNDLRHSLQSLQDILKKTEISKDEQKHLMETHVATEQTLRSQAETLLSVVIEASEDTQKLHEKLDRIA
ncbi:PREDICTED: uncharacterized protein LOC106742239 [Dinoponera quadriceps]|uniref:Uncharacterized protein LOC106742239 n=1 Tax=Dinoponera quadriceps TaxID=609295 RepID=A0A6P3WXW2_DINQU|nr:PREDICTED: uncharacterized protein LOC106742239 [Dinoponera quadriceps]